MGDEEIEIRDTNGNPVKVRLHATITNIGQHLALELVKGRERGEPVPDAVAVSSQCVLVKPDAAAMGGGEASVFDVALTVRPVIARAALASMSEGIGHDMGARDPDADYATAHHINTTNDPALYVEDIRPGIELHDDTPRPMSDDERSHGVIVDALRASERERARYSKEAATYRTERDALAAGLRGVLRLYDERPCTCEGGNRLCNGHVASR